MGAHHVANGRKRVPKLTNEQLALDKCIKCIKYFEHVQLLAALHEPVTSSDAWPHSNKNQSIFILWIVLDFVWLSLSSGKHLKNDCTQHAYSTHLILESFSGDKNKISWALGHFCAHTG